MQSALLILVLFSLHCAWKASVDICNYDVTQLQFCLQLAKFKCLFCFQSALYYRLQSSNLNSVFNFAFIGARKASVNICNYGISQISICYQLAKLECFSRLQSALLISVFNFAFIGAQKASVDIAATIYYTLKRPQKVFVDLCPSN